MVPAVPPAPQAHPVRLTHGWWSAPTCWSGAMRESYLVSLRAGDRTTRDHPVVPLHVGERNHMGREELGRAVPLAGRASVAQALQNLL